jgi:hypothetical protein
LKKLKKDDKEIIEEKSTNIKQAIPNTNIKIQNNNPAKPVNNCTICDDDINNNS